MSNAECAASATPSTGAGGEAGEGRRRDGGLRDLFRCEDLVDRGAAAPAQSAGLAGACDLPGRGRAAANRLADRSIADAVAVTDDHRSTLGLEGDYTKMKMKFKVIFISMASDSRRILKYQ